MKRLILGMSLLITVTCFAQSIQIDDVKGRRFTGVKTILADDGETVSGYYTYYLVEKGSKGMRTLEFSIIDKG
ncbi:MAG: hypothetical protein QMC70_06655, partial [Bacteroidia bacterium]